MCLGDGEDGKPIPSPRVCRAPAAAEEDFRNRLRTRLIPVAGVAAEVPGLEGW